MAASKNTYSNSCRPHILGRRCELYVEYLLKKNNFSIEFSNLKTFYGEIDIIATKAQFVDLIEVKSLNDSWRSFERIRPNQVMRLKRNQLALQRLFPEKKVRSFIVWVNKNVSANFIEL